MLLADDLEKARRKNVRPLIGGMYSVKVKSGTRTKDR